MFHLENTLQQRKEGRKRQSWDLHDISVLGKYPQETQVKDRKDHKFNSHKIYSRQSNVKINSAKIQVSKHSLHT